MILRQTRASLQFATCCQGNIHTTSPFSADPRDPKTPRDPKKEWQGFTDRVKETSYWWRSRAARTFKDEKVKFEKVRQEYEGKRSKEHERSDREKESSSFDKGGQETYQGRFLSLFPTTAKFNSFFDRGLSKLPTGMDLVRKVPAKYRPYLLLSRMDKPIGSWLLFLPGAWGICIAAPTFGLPSVPLLALFGTGAILMRGAGCTINDMYDIDIDKQVIRTRERPLASNMLNKQQALQWLAIQLGLSSLILFSLNKPTIVLGISSLILIGAYPLMKRITDYPQLFLGITFNLGALMGYSAATGTLSLTPFALYSAGICWTMIYDTIYAHQDKEDDRSVGVRSTALKFGDRTMQVCSNFVTGMGLSLFVAGIAGGLGPTYFFTTFLSCCMLLRGLSLVQLNNPTSCWEFFVMNRNIGLLILFGIIVGKFL